MGKLFSSQYVKRCSQFFLCSHQYFLAQNEITEHFTLKYMYLQTCNAHPSFPECTSESADQVNFLLKTL